MLTAVPGALVHPRLVMLPSSFFLVGCCRTPRRATPGFRAPRRSDSLIRRRRVAARRAELRREGF